jgi:membrane protease YdiL (CAAX protease family)
MSDTGRRPSRPLLISFFLSPDEPRLRAGWRLFLHTIILGLVSSIFFVVGFFLTLPFSGENLETSLAVLTLGLLSILLATWIARRFIDRRSFRSLGFNFSRQSWIDLGVGFAIPGFLMGFVFFSELLFGWTTFEHWAWQGESPGNVALALFSGLFAFILVGFSEEILSRGYHLQNLRDGLNLGWALLISSGIFALLHSANPNGSWISTIGILLAGFFLAYGWIRTGQLWLSIGLHIGWNFFEGNVFGFPVSGLSTYRLIHHTTTGPEIITGGAFGPEAGLVVLPAMALGVLLIYLYSEKFLRSPQVANETPPS